MRPTRPTFSAAALAAAGIAALTLSVAPVRPQAAEAFTAEQKKAIEQIVKDYLVANPEIMVDVQNALEAKLEKVQAEKLKTVLAESADDIFKKPTAPVAGNPNGDITVVEFFDYNCGYCKKGLTDVVKLLDKDSKVKLVLMELPILSAGSMEASKVALAARLQGKYWEVHRGLLESKGQVNEAAALKIAEKQGLDMARLKKDMASAEVKAEIDKTAALARRMGVNGTPHFLVGDRSIAGAPQDLYDQMTQMAQELRKTGCAVC